MLSPGLRAALFAPRYDVATRALLARFTTPATSARAQAIDACIRSLKATGLWSKLDGFCPTAAADSQAARQNWIADRYNLTPLAAPVLDTDRGYTGDGSAAYLNTNFNPATAGGLYTQDSAHLGVWRRTLATNTANSPTDIGAIAAGSPFPGEMIRTNASGEDFQVNNNLAAVAATAGTGHRLATRSSSTGFTPYVNGSALSTVTAASTALNNGNIYVLARNQGGTASSFSNGQIAVVHWGSGLTAQNVTDLYNAIHTYLQAVGAAS